MSNFLPRIEFGGTGVALSLIGDTTISNDTITNVTDTTGTVVGQNIEGSGIPASTTVLSFTATTIQMSANATASASSVSLTLFTRLDFDLPPEGDNLQERTRANVKRTISNNGTLQNQFNYNEQTFRIRLVFLTGVQVVGLRTFFEDHGSRGFEFKYFESADEVTFFTMTLDRPEFKPQRIIKEEVGDDFIQDVELRLRRTI